MKAAIMATIKLLSARTVATIAPGYHADGGNLFLRVLETGSRSWFFRYKKAGKQISLGLGATHARSLAQAREVAQQMRTAILNGVDPASVLKQGFESATITFKQHAESLIDSKRPSWRNAKHAQQWSNTLEQYAYPRIGNKLASDVTVEDMKAILEPIWVKKTETASRVRMRIESVLDYAAVHEGTDARNPASWKGTLDKVLPPPRKVTKVVHHPAAPYADIPRIMTELRNKDHLSAYCLRFIILTAARSGEGRGAKWTEIDMDAKLWSIPATRMKAERNHVVPLCEEAMQIVTTMKTWRRDGSDLVFPSVRAQLSDVAVTKMLHSVAPNVTVHGCRTSFRTWGAEATSTPSAVMELALAHVNQNQVEAAYQRSDLLDLRKKLMQTWGEWCKGGGGTKDETTNSVAQE